MHDVDVPVLKGRKLKRRKYNHSMIVFSRILVVLTRYHCFVQPFLDRQLFKKYLKFRAWCHYLLIWLKFNPKILQNCVLKTNLSGMLKTESKVYLWIYINISVFYEGKKANHKHIGQQMLGLSLSFNSLIMKSFDYEDFDMQGISSKILNIGHMFWTFDWFWSCLY